MSGDGKKIVRAARASLELTIERARLRSFEPLPLSVNQAVGLP